MAQDWITRLTDQGARFADGRVADYGNAAAEQAAADIVSDLSHEGLILVEGADAAAFLHAQFTSDVLSLEEGRAQWSGWCTPKGRLLATFLLWRGRQGYFLQLPRALQAAIQKRLGMFVLRSKVTISDASDAWLKLGLAGPGAELLVRQAMGEVPPAPMQSVHTERGRVIRLSAERFEIIGKPEHIAAIWESTTATRAGASAWDARAIRDGIPAVVLATQDAFVPQMVNFDLIGAVSFTKGCYPGQEIVARTKYRGILKRRMVRVAGSAAMAAGDSVYSAVFGDQAAGTIVEAAPVAGGYEALAVAQIEAIKDGALTHDALHGAPLAILPLPYDVPELA